MPSTNLTNWDRFCLLTWKNFFILWNNRRQMLCVLFMPLIIVLPLIIVRYHVDPIIVPEKRYETIDIKGAWTRLWNSTNQKREAIQQQFPQFKSNTFVPELLIGFAPDLYKDIEKLINEAIASLDPQPELRGSHSCRQLEEMIRKNNYLCGLCFHNFYDDDDLENNKEPIIQILNFTMIFPDVLRMPNYERNDYTKSWPTDVLYQSLRSSDELYNRGSEENHGGYPGYVREGFIPLQEAISRAYLNLINSDNEKIPEVEFKRFPYQRHVNDMVNMNLITLPCVILLGFLMPTVSFTYLMTREKDHNLKDFINAIGVPNFVIFASWGVVGLFLFSCCSLVVLAALQMNWNKNDYSIIDKVDSSVLLVILLTYSMAGITFCIFVSSLFKDSHSCVAAVGVLSVITFIPYVPGIHSRALYLFLNTIMGHAFELIFYYEIYDYGLQWNVVFKDDIIPYVSCGSAICMFLVHSIVYMFLAVIMESINPFNFFNSKLWNILFKRSGKRNMIYRRSSFVDPSTARVMQVEPLYKTQLVSVENLTKIYKKREVVQNINLNLYENDITVLLGHNGSGKTTLLSLLLGVLSPSDGRIRIEDYDIAKYKSMACANLGGCLRDHLLFHDLSVENQIRFFSRLKGLSWKEADNEVQKYCRKMEMNDKKNVLTKDLTVGLKHQLAVCCALAGNSKIVVLDEPNYGMGLAASKLVSKLLISEKKRRTILVSTNSTEMADAIADRVSIMANGTIICSGSIVFLRNMYNRGSRLLITTQEGCKPENVTKCIQQFIPDIKIEGLVVKTIMYTIHETYSHLIGDILEALEKELFNLSIESYAVDDLSIYDIVLKMTSTVSSSDPDYSKRSASMNQSVVLTQDEPAKVINQKLKAIFLTRMIYYQRHIWLFLGQVLLPILFAIIVSQSMGHTKQNYAPRILALDSYPNSKVVVGEITNLNDYMHRIAYEYKETVFWTNNVHYIEEVNGDRFEDILIQIMSGNPVVYERNILAAVVFTDEKITAYFNNYPYHSAPISFNLVYNSIARNIRSKDTQITVRVKTLKLDSDLWNSLVLINTVFYDSFVFLTLLSTMITLSNSVYDMTISHSASLRHWFNIGGAVKQDFWITTIIFDSIRTVLISLVIIISLISCITGSIVHLSAFGYIFLLLVLGGVCINSIHYVFIKLFKNAQPCFRASLAFGAIGVILHIMEGEVFFEQYFGNAIKYLPLTHPYYAMGSGILVTKLLFRLHIECDKNEVFALLAGGELKCTRYLNYLDLQHGILAHVIALISVTIFSWIFVFFLENLSHFRRIWLFEIAKDDIQCAWNDHRKRHAPDAPTTLMEDSVTHQEILLYTMRPNEQRSIPIIIDRLGKNFGVVTALHRFSFVLDKCQLCGILGLNGAGKTVLLKILANELIQSYGEVRMFGENVLEKENDVFRSIGYCPEILEIIFEYTPREVLELFAALAEIPSRKLPIICEQFAKTLGFYGYYNKVLKTCSDGIQKRVGTALALIGKRPILLLDEPLSAIDPAGKLMIYNTLSKTCRTGASVLFTSLSPTECQKICNKIIILIDGHLIDTGTLSDLYNRSEWGYLLQVRLKPYLVFESRKSTGNQKEEHANRFLFENSKMRVITFIQTIFKGASFRNIEGNLVSFVVPIEHNVSRIYSTVRNNAFSYNIESFGVARAPLQMVYLNIVDRHKMNLN